MSSDPRLPSYRAGQTLGVPGGICVVVLHGVDAGQELRCLRAGDAPLAHGTRDLEQLVTAPGAAR